MYSFIQVGWSNYLTYGLTMDEWETDAIEIAVVGENVLWNSMSPAGLASQAGRYMQYLGPQCSARADPEYLAHLNIPIVVQDFDFVHNLTGAESFKFYGISDGSMVGISYAALFPQ